MAKKSKKYSFQRNKKKTITWIAGIVAVIVALVIGIVVYNNSRTIEFDVAVPEAEKLNYIAENLDVLTSHTDKFDAYPQEDGSTTLNFKASEQALSVTLFVNNGIENPSEFCYSVLLLPNIFTAPIGTDMKAGEISIQTGNENLMIRVNDYPVEAADATVVDAIIAELEAIIAEGPVVTETTEATEDATEATEDAAEATEDATEAAE